MKKIIISLILILVVFVYLFANTNDFSTHLENAKQYYQNEKYEDAIDEYEMLILNGFNNPYVYYNLSDAYYKNNEIGKAVLNLERAIKLMPRNKDFQINRDIFANIVQESKKNIAEQFLYKVLLFCSLNEIILITLILFVLLAVLLSLYFLKLNKKLIPFIILISIFNIFSFLLFSLKYYDEVVLDKCVIIKNADVRNNPSKEEEVSFEINEGRQAIILSEVGRWINIKLSSDGLTGWVDKNIIEKI